MQALFYAEPSNNLYRQMLATDYGNYGRILMDLEELEAAEPFFEQESSLSQLLTAIDPQNRDYAFGRVLAHKNLGDYYFRINDPSSGAEQYQSALAKSETLWEHLVGSQFTRAALAAASLLSPLAVPEPHHTCYAALFPPNVAKDARAWAERPAIVWVRDTYRRYRQ